MKQIFQKTWMVIIVLWASLSSFAYDFELDGIYYSVISLQDLTCEVVQGDRKCEGEIVIPSKVTYNNQQLSVMTIGKNAFKNCNALTSVTINNSVTEIGEGAFWECTSLTSIVLPATITRIGSMAFYETGIKSISMPESIKDIGRNAFACCDYLQNAEFASIESLCSINFVDGNSNPLSMASHLYINGAEVTNIEIPESVIRIGSYAFYGSDIKSIKIPESIKYIGKSAFEGCDSLQLVDFASIESVCSIQYYYDSQWAPTECGVPNPLYLTGRLVINGVEVTHLDIPESVTQINPIAFFGCKGLTSVNIPNTAKTIGWGAFCFCDGLTSFDLPNSVILIDDYAFSYCTTFTSIVIPDSVKEIGSGAFECCKNIHSLTIPDSVSEIGEWAFYDCINLESIYYNTTQPVSGSVHIFHNSGKGDFSYDIYENACLYVPEESFLTFRKKSPWKYFDHINIYNFSSSVEEWSKQDYINCPIYTFDGIPVNLKIEDLPNGIYIKRERDKISKIMINR